MNRGPVQRVSGDHTPVQRVSMERGGLVQSVSVNCGPVQRVSGNHSPVQSVPAGKGLVHGEQSGVV